MRLKIDYTFRFTFLVGADCLLAHSNLNLRASTRFPIAIFISSVKDFQSVDASSNHALETKSKCSDRPRGWLVGLTFLSVFHAPFFMSHFHPQSHIQKVIFRQNRRIKINSSGAGFNEKKKLVKPISVKEEGDEVPNSVLFLERQFKSENFRCEENWLVIVRSQREKNEHNTKERRIRVYGKQEFNLVSLSGVASSCATLHDFPTFSFLVDALQYFIFSPCCVDFPIHEKILSRDLNGKCLGSAAWVNALHCEGRFIFIILSLCRNVFKLRVCFAQMIVFKLT